VDRIEVIRQRVRIGGPALALYDRLDAIAEARHGTRARDDNDVVTAALQPLGVNRDHADPAAQVDVVENERDAHGGRAMKTRRARGRWRQPRRRGSGWRWDVPACRLP